MKRWLSAANIVWRKDLAIERRARVTLSQVLPVVVLLLVVLAFALDGNAVLLGQSAAGAFWVVVLVAMLLVAKRSFDIEAEHHNLDALKLISVAPSAVFAGKAGALALQVAAAAAVAAGGVVVFYDARVDDPLLGIAAIVAGLVAICAAGTLFGVMTVGVRAAGALLALLLLPVTAPVMLAGSRALDVALGTTTGSGWSWVALMAILGALYTTLGLVTFGPLLEDA